MFRPRLTNMVYHTVCVCKQLLIIYCMYMYIWQSTCWNWNWKRLPTNDIRLFLQHLVYGKFFTPWTVRCSLNVTLNMLKRDILSMIFRGCDNFRTWSTGPPYKVMKHGVFLSEYPKHEEKPCGYPSDKPSNIGQFRNPDLNQPEICSYPPWNWELAPENGMLGEMIVSFRFKRPKISGATSSF